MKTNYALAALLLSSVSIQATTITWDNAAPPTSDNSITDSSIVIGNVIGAWNLAGRSGGAPYADQTIAGGVTFKAIYPTSGAVVSGGITMDNTLVDGRESGYWSGPATDAAFQSIMGAWSGKAWNGSSTTLTLSGLTAETDYRIQFLYSATNNNNINSGANIDIDGSATDGYVLANPDPSGDGTGDGLGQYITGTLTTGVGETSAVITLSDKGEMSAVVLALPASAVDLKITSFTSVGGAVWELTVEGEATTRYEFRSSPLLDYNPGTLIENLTQGDPGDAGSIGGVNDSVLTTDGSGNGKLRVTLSGLPADFVRMQAAPPAPPLYSWDFEADNDGFTVTGTPNDWEWGTPDSDNNAGLVLNAGNSTKCWATVLGTGTAVPRGTINTAADSILRTPDMDLTGISGAQLAFSAAIDATDTDVFEVLIRKASDNIQLGSTIIPATLPVSAEWADFGPFDLSAADDELVYLEFRFKGQVDGFIGLYLDDVTIIAP